MVAAAEGERPNPGVERQRGGQLAVRFGEAAGDPQVAALQLGVGEPRLALETELIETVPVGLSQCLISIGHIDILA